MRRIFILAATLALLGLSTAFAASFGTQSEDVKSFSTAVSISVPPSPVTRLYLQGDENTVPGSLSSVATPTNTQSRLIKKDDESVQQQADVDNFFVWQTATVTGTPMVIGGTTRLIIHQENKEGSRLSAGLFNCPAAAAVSSSTSTGCVQIGPTAFGPVPEPGFKEVTVNFGSLPSTPIPVGNQLRLKIVNRAEDPPGTVLSTADFKVSWGLNPARESRLEFGP